MLLSLLAAGCWGTSAFLAGLTAKRVSTLAVVGYSQAASLVVLAVAVALWPASPTMADIAWGALAGVGTIVALTAFYEGLAVGRMSVVSPLAALIAVSTPASLDFVRGTPPTGGMLGGLALACVAIVLLSTSTHGSEPGQRSGAWHAVVAGLGFSLFLIALDQASPTAGLWPLVGTRMVSAVALCLLLVATRRTEPIQARAHWRAIVGIGVIDIVGAALYLGATTMTTLTAAVVLSNLHPLVTVLWARVLLHEHLGPRRLAGVTGSLGAIILIASG
jgi:drug/metabolite transporter (DMT)-like permease